MFPQRAEIKEKSEPIIGSRRKFLIIIGFSNELKEKIIAHYTHVIVESHLLIVLFKSNSDQEDT